MCISIVGKHIITLPGILTKNVQMLIFCLSYLNTTVLEIAYIGFLISSKFYQLECLMEIENT